MKKLNYLLFAFAIAASMLTLSCNKDDDNNAQSKTKVSALVYKDYEGTGTDDSIVFIYNPGGLLTKAEKYEVTSTSRTLVYSSEFEYLKNNPVSVISYEWNGTTKIPNSKDSVSYDSQNRIVTYHEFDLVDGRFVREEDDFTTVTYGTNNLPIRYTYASGEYLEVEYANNNVSVTKDYDHSTLVETDTYNYDSKKNPFKGLPYFMDEMVYYNTNNYTSRIDNYGSENAQYVYNDEGYPIKVIDTYSSNDTKKAGTIYSPKHKLYRNKKAGYTSTDVIKIYYK